jgi:DNA-binding IclR family transcriptional regulator
MERDGSPSVDAAARILELLTRYRTAHVSLTQISNAIEHPKSSCYRILKTLERHGLLRYDSVSRLYSLGPYALILGARAEENIDYIADIKALLSEAASRSAMTAVWIQQIDPNRMMYVSKQDVIEGHGVGVSVGNRFPITEVSYGKWVVAYASSAEAARILADGLPQVTSATTTDVAEYRRQVDEARRAGVLMSRGEYIEGIYAASCPIVSPAGDLLGVLAVLGMMPSMMESDYVRAADVVRDISRRSARNYPLRDDRLAR